VDFHRLVVTSDLALKNLEGRKLPRRKQSTQSARKTRKIFEINILTSKPYGLKILQTIFAKPAPVAASETAEGRGTRFKAGFPKTEPVPKAKIRHCAKNFKVLFQNAIVADNVETLKL